VQSDLENRGSDRHEGKPRTAGSELGLSPESPIQHVNGQHRSETVTEEKDLVDRPGTGCLYDLVGRGIKPALEFRIIVSDVRAREYPVVKGEGQIGPSSRAEIKCNNSQNSCRDADGDRPAHARSKLARVT